MNLVYGAGAVQALARYGAGIGQRFRRSPATADALVLGVVGVMLLAGEYYTEAAPAFFQFAIDYQAWEVDNLIFMTFLMSIGLMAFSARRVRELRREIKARQDAELQATRQARHDPLTGLPNRRYFIERLKDVLRDATQQAPSAVLMLDLDGFKSINDAYGHAAGDQVLIEFTRKVSALMRAGASLIRMGGDEFAVIVPDPAALAGPEALARRIIAEVAEPFVIDHISTSVGVGVGIAMAPADGRDPELLVQRADRALYRAKAGGRSRICFFEPELDAHVDRRIALEASLRAAVAAGEITPHYQPIVMLQDARIVGFEALARWRNEKGEWIAPDVFIRIAEDIGIIGELGDKLLRRACLDARAWPEELTLAFNISGKQLSDPGVGLRILAILGETGFSPRRLEIEITETAVVASMHVAQTVASQLRQAGVRIALDDFGVGYSTFGQLLSLKLDRIKIDRSFVHRLCEDADRKTIVRAVLGLASGLRLATTAEGIENAEQLAMLNADGCMEGQGYLFGKAVPAEAVPLLLADGTLRHSAA